jgi:hypothetical protein
MSTNKLFFFISLQYLTFFYSYALSHRAKLHTGHVICADPPSQNQVKEQSQLLY